MTDLAQAQARILELEAEVDRLKRKRIEDAGRHERDLALNEYKMKNDDLCERRANQLRGLILAILSGKEAAFIGELEDARDRYFHLGMEQSNKIATLEAENAALRQDRDRLASRCAGLEERLKPSKLHDPNGYY